MASPPKIVFEKVRFTLATDDAHSRAVVNDPGVSSINSVGTLGQLGGYVPAAELGDLLWYRSVFLVKQKGVVSHLWSPAGNDAINGTIADVCYDGIFTWAVVQPYFGESYVQLIDPRSGRNEPHIDRTDGLPLPESSRTPMAQNYLGDFHLLRLSPAKFA